MNIGIPHHCRTIPSVRTYIISGVSQLCRTAISPLIRIEPSFADIIITNLSVRCTYFQHIQKFQSFHKFLFTDHPADCTGREKGKTVITGKLLRTIIRTIHLKEITLSIIVGGTKCPIFPIMRNFTTGRIFLTAEKSHRSNIMLTEFTCPIQLKLIIDTAISSLVIHFSTTSIPLLALLKLKLRIIVSNLLVIHLSGFRINIFSLCFIVQVIHPAFTFQKRIIQRK